LLPWRKTLRREGGPDSSRPAYRILPARASDSPSWRQRTHLRLLCLQLSILV
jgi:hypothetical protein